VFLQDITPSPTSEMAAHSRSRHRDPSAACYPIPCTTFEHDTISSQSGIEQAPQRRQRCCQYVSCQQVISIMRNEKSVGVPPSYTPSSRSYLSMPVLLARSVGARQRAEGCIYSTTRALVYHRTLVLAHLRMSTEHSPWKEPRSRQCALHLPSRSRRWRKRKFSPPSTRARGLVLPAVPWCSFGRPSPRM
jgi:hypothetical protein